MNVTQNAYSWIFENLVGYLTGTRLLLGILILGIVLISLYALKINKLALAIGVIPILLALTMGGYLPIAVQIIVYAIIGFIWIIVAMMMINGG